MIILGFNKYSKRKYKTVGCPKCPNLLYLNMCNLTYYCTDNRCDYMISSFDLRKKIEQGGQG